MLPLRIEVAFDRPAPEELPFVTDICIPRAPDTPKQLVQLTAEAFGLRPMR